MPSDKKVSGTKGPSQGTSPTKRALGSLSSLLDLTPFRDFLSGHFLLFGDPLWARIGLGPLSLTTCAPHSPQSDQEFVKTRQRWLLAVKWRRRNGRPQSTPKLLMVPHGELH